MRFGPLLWAGEPGCSRTRPRVAHASATFHSLIETAKANQLEPYGYIKYLLDHIGAADTLEKLETLLPWQVPMEAFSKKVNVFDGDNRRI